MPEVSDLPTRDLLALYASILDELVERGVVRSRNAPLGDLAETLVAHAYRGDLAPVSEKSWDVLSEDGRLLQVKARLIVGGRRRGQYSVFRSWGFDACVFLLLDASTYGIVEATEVPCESARQLATRSGWVAAERIRIATPLLSAPGAVDVTERVRHALLALP